jgi:hypothetical protein
MDPHAGNVVQRLSIHCDPSASITKQMLNPMSNKHKECGYYNFLIGGLMCYGGIVESFFYICVISISRLKYCITRHGYKT